MEGETKVLDLIRDSVLRDIPGPIDLYLSKKARDKFAILTWTGYLHPPANLKEKTELWVAFIDLMPGANFDHPVKYVFIDPGSGTIEVLDKLTPPNDLFENYKRYADFIKGKEE